MSDVDIYANKLKFKLKSAIVKLNHKKPVNIDSSTRLIITPLTKGIPKYHKIKSPYKSSPSRLSPHRSKAYTPSKTPIKAKDVRLKFNNSANVNLGNISKPNLKLFSIKKNSQYYNNNYGLPLTKSATISLNSLLNTQSFNSVINNSFNYSNFKSKSFNDVEAELPPINKILKTPLKLSKSPIKNFTPNSLNVAKSLLSLGGYY